MRGACPRTDVANAGQAGRQHRRRLLCNRWRHSHKLGAGAGGQAKGRGMSRGSSGQHLRSLGSWAASARGHVALVGRRDAAAQLRLAPSCSESRPGSREGEGLSLSYRVQRRCSGVTAALLAGWLQSAGALGTGHACKASMPSGAGVVRTRCGAAAPPPAAGKHRRQRAVPPMARLSTRSSCRCCREVGGRGKAQRGHERRGVGCGGRCDQAGQAQQRRAWTVSAQRTRQRSFRWVSRAKQQLSGAKPWAGTQDRQWKALEAATALQRTRQPGC